MDRPQLRVAGPSDSELLFAFLVGEFHGLYRSYFPAISVAKVCRHIDYHLEFGRVVIAERGDQMVGTIAAAPSSMWWSDSIHLADGWFFVSPRARASRLAVQLIAEIEHYADELGLPLMLGVITPDQLDRKAKFFVHRGYTCRGLAFVRSPKM